MAVMTELPTIGLTDDQYELVWSKIPGDTDAEKVAAYQEWLTGQLNHYVLGVIRQEQLAQGEAQMIQAVEEAAASLP